MQQRQTFTRKERLNSKKLIEKLFKKSRFFFDFPFKVLFYYADQTEILSDDSPVQVLFTTSKRFLKKAVSRNLAKRIMRDAFRKNKIPLHKKLTDSNKKLILGFVYTGHQTPEYHKIEQKIILIINRLIQEVDREEKYKKSPIVNHEGQNINI